MNKITRIVIALIVIINLISCKDKVNDIQYFSENDFPELVKLKGDRKPTKEMLNINNFLVQDSFLIIDNSRDDSVFMVFDLNTFDCIKSWGIRGRGPGEYEAFTHLIDISPEKFQIADFSRYRIETYSIPEFELKSEQKIIIDSEIREIPQTIATTDGFQYFYDCFYDHHELAIAKWKNEEKSIKINRFDQYNKLYESAIIYSGSFALNKSENKLVYAHRFMRRFSIMNFEGELIKTVEITPSASPATIGKNIDIKKSELCYFDVKATSNSFFLLYVGHLAQVLEENKFLLPCYIEEYDWDGNPIKRYELDRYISNFEIIYDKQKQSIFFLGIDITDNNPLIIFSEHF